MSMAHAREIFIKLATRDYNQLRGHIPPASSVQNAISKATPIDHALDGVQFAGYTIPCDEVEAHIILDIAKQCCPDTVPAIVEAIRLARSGSEQ